MVSHHTVKFGGNGHCFSGDMFLLVEETDFTSSLNSPITIFSKAHDMSCSHMRNLTIKIALTKTFASVSNER